MNPYYGRILKVMPLRRRRPIDWILPASIGLSVGAIFGLGAGLLLAPRPGDETIKRLRDGAIDLKRRAQGAADRARGRLATANERVEDRFTYGSNAR